MTVTVVPITLRHGDEQLHEARSLHTARSMTGIKLAPGVRVGDYVLEQALPGKPTELAFEASHMLLPRRARLVALHPALAGNHAAGVELMKEACIVEALRHPAVPRVYECGILADRRPWFAIEMAEGPTIAELTALLPLSVADVLVLLHEVGAVLDHAHTRGVVHGDIRPAVIAQCADGLRVTDWSLSTLDTSAPSDVYALGVVAYAALTLELPGLSAAERAGRALPALPVGGRSPGETAPAELTALIDRMLSTYPHIRPTSAELSAEATRIIELDVDAPEIFIFDDGPAIEQEEVVLVDISRDPPPLPRHARLRWTPMNPFTPSADAKPPTQPRRKP
jgi:serine/threonine protein kinase